MSDDLAGPTIGDDLQAVRDLVSQHPLNKYRVLDHDSWIRLCDGMDSITDAPTAAQRLDALNVVKAEIGMSPIGAGSGADLDLVLTAGVAAVRAELEEEVNEHYRRFASEQLADVLGTNPVYGAEKAAGAVGSRLREEADSSYLWDRACLDSLRKSLAGMDEALAARGYDERVRSCVTDAVYILDRGAQMLDGVPGAPNVRDIYLLARHGLPALVSDVEAIAKEIDETYASRRGGWLNPDAPPLP